MFAPLFDDSFTNHSPDVSPISIAQPDHIHEPETPGQITTTVVTDGPPIDSPSTADHTASNSSQPAEDLHQQSVPQPADYDPNSFFNPFAPAPIVPDIAESSTCNLDPSNLHDAYLHHPSTHQWTRDHPLVQRSRSCHSYMIKLILDRSNEVGVVFSVS